MVLNRLLPSSTFFCSLLCWCFSGFKFFTSWCIASCVCIDVFPSITALWSLVPWHWVFHLGKLGMHQLLHLQLNYIKLPHHCCHNSWLLWRQSSPHLTITFFFEIHLTITLWSTSNSSEKKDKNLSLGRNDTVWNWNFKLLYWFFNLYSFLLAVGCCSNFKQEIWSAVVSLKEKWLQAANICKQRHFDPPHIVASLLYDSCLKVKADGLARLDKFEFVGLVKVICKPVVQFFRSIFYMKQMLRFYPLDGRLGYMWILLS